MCLFEFVKYSRQKKKEQISPSCEQKDQTGIQGFESGLRLELLQAVELLR